MQDNISLFRTLNRDPGLGRTEAMPVRRLVLRGDRNYLRALRAAEMAAWQHNTPSRSGADRDPRNKRVQSRHPLRVPRHALPGAY